VLVAVGAAVAVFLLHVPLPLLPHPRAKGQPAVHLVSVTVPAITTNLSGADAAHFAQVQLTLSLSGAKTAKTFAARTPAVQDACITAIRDRSAAQLNDVAGMTGLRTAIVTAVDGVLGDPTAVRAVYFTQFVVQ